MKQLHLTIVALFLSFASFAVLGPITGSTHVCVGSSITLGNSTSGGAWTSGALSVATVGSSSGSVVGISAGIATITYTAGASFVTTTITVNSLPGVYVLSGGGYFCGSAAASASFTLSGSDAGISYQLYKSGVVYGSPLTGAGSTLTWGPYTSAGCIPW